MYRWTVFHHRCYVCYDLCFRKKLSVMPAESTYTWRMQNTVGWRVLTFYWLIKWRVKADWIWKRRENSEQCEMHHIFLFLSHGPTPNVLAVLWQSFFIIWSIQVLKWSLNIPYTSSKLFWSHYYIQKCHHVKYDRKNLWYLIHIQIPSAYELN